MSEETYDAGRPGRLEELLRALAERIRTLDQEGRLLANPAELITLIGEARSELFHYEVRATYDTPEIAEHRRIVAESKENEANRWEKTEWSRDEEDDPTW